MSDNVEKWAKQVSDAADNAVTVYEREVAQLTKRVAETDKLEQSAAEHVAAQIERDVRFAEHHIEYLHKVIEKENRRVESAYARLADRTEAGASDGALKRAAEHVAKVEVSAEKHIDSALDRVTKDIERDAKAAARHVVTGLETIDEYEEDLGDEATAEAERVVKALEKVGKKIDA